MIKMKSRYIPRLNKIVIQGKCNTNDLIRINLANFPEAKILKGIELAIRRASERIVVDLKQALDVAIQSPVWMGTLDRVDIYDTGELLNSGSVIINNKGITIAYDAPYAALVHYGGYIHPYGNITEKVYLPQIGRAHV